MLWNDFDLWNLTSIC